MRAAPLPLAFEGVAAVVARSGAFVDNLSSIGVSKALGYRQNGRCREAPRGDAKVMVNFEPTYDEWLRRSKELPRAAVLGLEPSVLIFGPLWTDTIYEQLDQDAESVSFKRSEAPWSRSAARNVRCRLFDQHPGRHTSSIMSQHFDPPSQVFMVAYGVGRWGGGYFS
jgi:hypothetical protein